MIGRRRFLALGLGIGAGAALAGWPLRVALGATGAAEGGPAQAEPDSGGLAPRTLRALDESPFVYVSPLLGDGSESTCHGEVWFAWLDGAVVLNTAPSTWKSRSLARGLDRARIWVGDHGRWKRLLGTNEDFRQAPHFDARAERSRDAELLDRLLAEYERKYPDEIARWRGPMREGFHDGSRWLIRYTPLPRSA